MLKKFTEGLVFGSGFGISFITISYITAYLIYPLFITSKIETHLNSEISDIHKSDINNTTDLHNILKTPDIPFHELNLSEKINNASVIAIASYVKSDNGKMKAIIQEFLKKDKNTEIFYNIGDEYPTSSYYPKENITYGDGVVIFFTGSPAMMQYSTTFEGNRIRGLGDLPVELLREKCKNDNNA